MKKLVIISIILLSLLQLSASAEEAVTTSYITISDQIPPNGAAKFTIYITNNQDFDEQFTIEVPDTAWNAQTYPLPYFTNGFQVAPDTQEHFVLDLVPIRTISFGRHTVQLDFKSKTSGERYPIFFTIDVREDLIVYPVEISSSLSIPSAVDPRNPFSVKVDLKNNQPVNLRDVVVKVQSKFFSKEALVDISRNADKTVEFTFDLDPLIPPQKDTLTATVTVNDTVISSASKDYEIVSYLPPFKIKIDTIRDLLEFTDVITITNDGNLEKEQEVQIPKRFLDQIFAVPTPKAYPSSIDGRSAFTWKVKLAPGQSTAATINRNYWSVLFSLIVIAIALALYFSFRSPIVVIKEARKVLRHGDSLTGIKVVLRIKNRGLQPIHNVRMTDRIPAVTVFLKETGDTARPSRMMHHVDENLVGWDLAEVLPRGERIISYEMKAKLGIVGGIDLKPASAKFRTAKGRELQAKSNSLDIFL